MYAATHNRTPTYRYGGALSENVHDHWIFLQRHCELIPATYTRCTVLTRALHGVRHSGQYLPTDLVVPVRIQRHDNLFGELNHVHELRVTPANESDQLDDGDLVVTAGIIDAKQHAQLVG